MTNAQWIPGWEGVYSASPAGVVYSHRGNAPKEIGFVAPDDRTMVVLTDAQKGRREAYTVSRLIYTLFVETIPDGHYIRHLDGNHRNNTVGNLVAEPKAEAIGKTQPATRQRFSNKQIEEMRKLREAGVPASEIGKRFGCAAGTVYKHTRGKRTAYLQNKHAEMLRLYESGMSISEIAEKLECDFSTAYRHLENTGAVKKKKLGMRAEMRRLRKDGLTLREISERLGCSQSTVRNHTKDTSISSFKERAEEMRAMRRSGVSAREISKRVGCSLPTVYANTKGARPKFRKG